MVASIPVGIPVFYLGVELGFIGGGDEGRWQPYTAAAGLLWAALVFAFVYPTARERWGGREGVVAAALVGIAACLVVFVSSIMVVFMPLILSGYEG